jgi:TatD DNase family protein
MNAVPLFDAHNHLHDSRLAQWRQEIIAELPGLGISRAVVNGTCESDWAAVAALAAAHCWVLPSFGLHPWHVNERSPAWREKLTGLLDAHPGCGLGEVGLDRWIEGNDPAAQADCLRWQLDLSAARNLPATIHCVRAWGALWDILRTAALPTRGFLLHAYGGPAEMVRGFIEKGAYFSFSPSFLHERKAPQRDIFRQLPPERILVETDAPDLVPPLEQNPRPLVSGDGKVLNHPANLLLAYDAFAAIREVSREELARQVAANFAKLFE